MAKKNNLKELKQYFTDCDEKLRLLALPLIEKAEFLEETLKKLEQKVVADGVVTEMCQGNYVIERENPALKSYNTTIKNYSTIIKQLNDMIPKETKNKNDGFDEFGDDVE